MKKDSVERLIDQAIAGLWEGYRQNYRNGGSLDSFLTFIEVKVEELGLVSQDAEVAA